MTAKVTQALRGGMFICPNGLCAGERLSEVSPRQVGAALRSARTGALDGVMAISPAEYAAAIDRPGEYHIAVIVIQVRSTARGRANDRILEEEGFGVERFLRVPSFTEAARRSGRGAAQPAPCARCPRSSRLRTGARRRSGRGRAAAAPDERPSFRVAALAIGIDCRRRRLSRSRSRAERRRGIGRACGSRTPD